MADQWVSPRFTKKQIVRISVYNSQGKPKNELARKALSYYSQVAEVVSSSMFEMGRKPILVYRVKADDGKILQLTEDCLMPVNDRH